MMSRLAMKAESSPRTAGTVCAVYFLWFMPEALASGTLADPHGMLAVELGLARKLVFEHLSQHATHTRTLQAMTAGNLWAAVHELGTTLAATVLEGNSADIRDVASLRALDYIALLELIAVNSPMRPGANQSLRSRVVKDLQWFLDLLPRGDRTAVALGHFVLSWFMFASLNADRDGFYRLESTSSITQAWWLSRQANSATVQRICEVGFNGGHSAWAMLSSATPAVQMVSFDLVSKSYTRACHRVIQSIFPHRHKLVEGPSNISIPGYVSQNLASKCDLIFIDGGHSEVDAASDLLQLSLLASKSTLVVMDDVGCESDFCYGPTLAWHSFISAGRIAQLGCQEELERRWCWGLYA